jgi:hypothetical protein
MREDALEPAKLDSPDLKARFPAAGRPAPPPPHPTPRPRHHRAARQAAYQAT